MRRTFLVATVLAASLAGVCHQQTVKRRDRFPPEEDLLYLPKPSALRVMSLGHHELSASLVFVRALVYFGGEIASTEKKFTWIDNYLDTMVSLDPQFEMGYRWAGSAIMYNGREITNEAVERSNHFLRRGVEQFPHSWQLPWMLGCNYMFEMRTKDPKQRKEWDRIGAEWIRQAALVGDAPAWASLLAAQIMEKDGRTEASIKYMEEVYLTTNDEKTKSELRNRINYLRKSQAAGEGLERKAKDFDSRWQRTLPYASTHLFVAIGERPSPRMDPSLLGRNDVLEAAAESEQEMRRAEDLSP